jgi:hypothetical protein
VSCVPWHWSSLCDPFTGVAQGAWPSDISQKGKEKKGRGRDGVLIPLLLGPFVLALHSDGMEV